MRKFMMLSGIVCFLVFAGFSYGQKKELSYEQIFKGAPSGLFKALPVISGWADDEHYLLVQKDSLSGKPALISVDAKTGKAVPYMEKPSARIEMIGNTEKNITTSPDGKWVAFTRDNNLYAREISTGKEVQFSSDGSNDIYNGYAAWLYYEEILGRNSHYRAFWWSPDSRHIAFMRFDESQVPVFPIYNSEGQHGSIEQQHYPKPGDKNPEVRIGIASVDHPAPLYADFDQRADQYFGEPVWTPDGSSLWVQWMPRSQDNLKIYAVDPSSGNKKEIYDEKQKTWIDLDLPNRINFLPDGKGFILKSDRTGWMHLYFYSMDGALINPVTQGDFTVTDLVKADAEKKWVYFKARKENSARTDLYKINLNGKGLTRLTFGNYSHDTISVSPKGSYFITTYSNLSTPWKMALVDSKGKIIRELGDSKGNAFDDYHLSRTEMVRVKSTDGLFDLPVTITYPLHFDPGKKYPVYISIYGGPDHSMVYDRWHKDVLKNQWLAKEGVIQVSMDNRASGHFGRAGMNYVYRQLGKYEIEDFMDCGRWLRTQPFVDTSKLCITGGSFGGYITCMALTYGADVFNYGIAISSVTDWRLYDTHYTERYMGLPEENPEGYRITSPQNYLQQYRGLLRIVHGNMDDNVHMQNSIQLIDKLEDLHKHFEFMIYPGERHTLRGLKAAHSTDEKYKFIYDHLLNKPMPENFWK